MLYNAVIFQCRHKHRLAAGAANREQRAQSSKWSGSFCSLGNKRLCNTVQTENLCVLSLSLSMKLVWTKSVAVQQNPVFFLCTVFLLHPTLYLSCEVQQSVILWEKRNKLLRGPTSMNPLNHWMTPDNTTVVPLVFLMITHQRMSSQCSTSVSHPQPPWIIGHPQSRR